MTAADVDEDVEPTTVEAAPEPRTPPYRLLGIGFLALLIVVLAVARFAGREWLAALAVLLLIAPLAIGALRRLHVTGPVNLGSRARRQGSPGAARRSPLGRSAGRAGPLLGGGRRSAGGAGRRSGAGLTGRRKGATGAGRRTGGSATGRRSAGPRLGSLFKGGGKGGGTGRRAPARSPLGGPRGGVLGGARPWPRRRNGSRSPIGLGGSDPGQPHGQRKRRLRLPRVLGRLGRKARAAYRRDQDMTRRIADRVRPAAGRGIRGLVGAWRGSRGAGFRAAWAAKRSGRRPGWRTFAPALAAGLWAGPTRIGRFLRGTWNRAHQAWKDRSAPEPAPEPASEQPAETKPADENTTATSGDTAAPSQPQDPPAGGDNTRERESTVISEFTPTVPETTEELTTVLGQLANAAPGMEALGKWCSEVVAGSLPLNPQTRAELGQLETLAHGMGAALEQTHTAYTAEQAA